MKKGFCEIPIEQLVKADWNYKEDNPELEQKLLENIKRNGQIENIIVRDVSNGKFEIVNGNHRLDVLHLAEFKTVYCFNLGKVSDTQAKRIAIETNETKFEIDMLRMSVLLKDIFEESDINDMLKTMPFNELELNDYLDFSEFSPDKLETNTDIVDEEKKRKEVTCPACGHTWDGS
jgi:ParB family transcriptional regulator, chromosome partitioning protein